MIPKISLAIDNCFLSKRYTLPKDWTAIISDMGINCIEASADTECDPLYMGGSYIKRWIEEVKRCKENSKAKVVNLYSGHGTYSTLGLCHTDKEAAEYFKNGWIKKHADTAAELESGLGFFAHAFDNSVLNGGKEIYNKYLNMLFDNLADIAVYCAGKGVTAGLEQMYSPHQFPWTLDGTEKLLKEVAKRSGKNFYISLDVGHMNGQLRFLKPDGETIEKAISEKNTGIWLGTKQAYDRFLKQLSSEKDKAASVKEILDMLEGYDYLFSKEEDGHYENWLKKFGAYSNIIHLQQTDGKSSPHWPFTAANNAKGIITGEKVLKSLYEAYLAPGNKDMPAKCESIMLTLEPFIGTGDNVYRALEDIKESAKYWRKYIPQDNMLLDEAVKKLS